MKAWLKERWPVWVAGARTAAALVCALWWESASASPWAHVLTACAAALVGWLGA